MFRAHPDLAQAIEESIRLKAQLPEPPPGKEAQAIRDRLDPGFASRTARLGVPAGVDVADTIIDPDGEYPIPVRLYTPTSMQPKAALLYLHGGGRICCSLETHDPLMRKYAADAGIVVAGVEYRLAPEHPHPASTQDCYRALAWLANLAPEIGIDPMRIAIGGESGGGGIAAGIALMARDRGGPALRGQFLVYPMLDDRTTIADPALVPFATWSYTDNATGWRALLGERTGTDAVDHYAAPARATDLTGLPSTYLEVGQLDIFRDETMAFASKLSADQVPVEFHLYPGANHAFDLYAPTSDLTIRAWDNRIRGLDRLLH